MKLFIITANVFFFTKMLCITVQVFMSSVPMSFYFSRIFLYLSIFLDWLMVTRYFCCIWAKLNNCLVLYSDYDYSNPSIIQSKFSVPSNSNNWGWTVNAFNMCMCHIQVTCAIAFYVYDNKTSIRYRPFYNTIFHNNTCAFCVGQKAITMSTVYHTLTL
jgi:hypothetical protein